MKTTIKTKVSIATIYVVFDDTTNPSTTQRVLFIGNPTKAEVKEQFTKNYEGNGIKKITICEIERMNIECDLTNENIEQSVVDIIVAGVEKITTFNCKVI